MVTHDDVGRRVWANASRGQLVRLTRVPDGRGGHHEIAVVRFERGEQVFPVAKVVLQERRADR